jgi:hypothetical protein
MGADLAAFLARPEYQQLPALASSDLMPWAVPLACDDESEADEDDGAGGGQGAEDDALAVSAALAAARSRRLQESAAALAAAASGDGTGDESALHTALQQLQEHVQQLRLTKRQQTVAESAAGIDNARLVVHDPLNIVASPFPRIQQAAAGPQAAAAAAPSGLAGTEQGRESDKAAFGTGEAVAGEVISPDLQRLAVENPARAQQLLSITQQFAATSQPGSSAGAGMSLGQILGLDLGPSPVSVRPLAAAAAAAACSGSGIGSVPHPPAAGGGSDDAHHPYAAALSSTAVAAGVEATHGTAASSIAGGQASFGILHMGLLPEITFGTMGGDNSQGIGAGVAQSEIQPFGALDTFNASGDSSIQQTIGAPVSSATSSSSILGGMPASSYGSYSSYSSGPLHRQLQQYMLLEEHQGHGPGAPLLAAQGSSGISHSNSGSSWHARGHLVDAESALAGTRRQGFPAGLVQYPSYQEAVAAACAEGRMTAEAIAVPPQVVQALPHTLQLPPAPAATAGPEAAADAQAVGRFGEALAYAYLQQWVAATDAAVSAAGGSTAHLRVVWVNAHAEQQLPFDCIIINQASNFPGHPTPTSGQNEADRVLLVRGGVALAEGEEVAAWVEVKSTRAVRKELFEISEPELRFAMQQGKRYWVLRVSGLGMAGYRRGGGSGGVDGGQRESVLAAQMEHMVDPMRLWREQAIKLCVVC